MELKNKIWMTGDLEWFTYIGGEEVYLGKREVPTPLAEGDRWVNEYGDVFQVLDREIRLVERVEPPQRFW